jgi:hypothetical protein
MIVDHTLVLSDHQAITADAASTNIWDLLAQGTPVGWVSAYGRDMGDGYHEIPMLVQVTEAFNTLTSLTISLQTDTTAAFSTPTTVATSGAVALANLTLGAQIPIFGRVPNGVNEQFVRLYYDVTGTDPTLGKIFAAVVAGRQTNVN